MAVSKSVRQNFLLYDELNELCKHKNTLIDWLKERELIKDLEGICDSCFEGRLYIRKDSSKGDGCMWRCSNKLCNKKKSIRTESW